MEVTVLKLDPLKVTQFVLKKQRLLAGFKAAGVVQAVRSVVGLQATDVTTPHLSLFARVKDFEKEHLDWELYERKSLGRVECMRSTLFIVPKEILPVVYQVYKGGLSEGFLRVWGISLQEYEELSHLILEALKGRTLTATQIKGLLPAHVQRALSRRVGKNIVRLTNVNLVLILLLNQGILLSMKGRGTWKPIGPNYYVRFADWFPGVNLNEVSREEARIRLVKLYLQSYGPATEKDVGWWTGFSMKEVERLLASLENEMVEVEISGLDSSFVMLKSDFAEIEPFKLIRGPSVSLLPYEDSYVKGYRERERIVSQEIHGKVYLHGEAQPTILVNGQILGTWRFKEHQGEVTIHLTLMEKVEKPIVNLVCREATAVGKFAYGKKVGLIHNLKA